MNETEREELRRYVNRWRETGAFLERLRREEIRNADLAETIGVFNDAFRSAVWLDEPENTSGLVRFHQILAKSK